MIACKTLFAKYKVKYCLGTNTSNSIENNKYFKSSYRDSHGKFSQRATAKSSGTLIYYLYISLYGYFFREYDFSVKILSVHRYI